MCVYQDKRYCYKPMAHMEAPYESIYSTGQGFDCITRCQKSSAFVEVSQTKIEKQDSCEVRRTDIEVIKSSMFYLKKIEATSSISWSGYGIDARASMAYSEIKAFRSTDVLFRFFTTTDFGFEGFSSVDLPKFSDAAKEAVCKDAEFTSTYGTHFIRGKKTGSSLSLNI